MMELQKQKLLLVFTMILVRATINEGSASPYSQDTLEKVEKTLLTALGIKNKPVIDRKKAHIPEAMLNLYKMQSEYESTALPLPGKLTRSANIVRSYTHQESEIDDRFPHNHKFRLFFNVSDLPANETLISSELRLTIIVPKDNRSDSINAARCRDAHVHVYDILQPGIKGLSQPILRRVETARVHTTSSELTLDVLPVLERWLSNRSHNHNHGLLLEVRSLRGDKCSSHVRLRRSLQPASSEPLSSTAASGALSGTSGTLSGTSGTSGSLSDTSSTLSGTSGTLSGGATSEPADTRWHSEQPLLLLYTEDERNRRSRRGRVDLTTLTRRKRSTRSRRRQRDECRRYPLQIRFKDVGWDDWIVAPSDYHAYYCAGECPTQMGDHLNTTNHAVVQALISSVYPNTIPKPCCVPTSLSPISMLYLNENSKAVLKNYDSMVVEGCGCR